MKQAFSYLRVSGKAQVAGDGFPRQREAISTYAKANGFDIVEEFAERGITGTAELEDREALACLMDRAVSNGVKIVLVERADRLARDLMVGEIILGQFRDAGVTVIAVDSGTDLTVGDNDPTRTLIRQVLGAVAQFEKSVLVMKLRAARMRKRSKDGRCEGRKPYGTQAGETAILAMIVELRRKTGGKRRSCAKIAATLNEWKKPTRQGGPWAPGTVARILREGRIGLVEAG